MTHKLHWKKPELIVLVRNKPEESILGTCKDAGGGHAGPSVSDRKCNSIDSGCPNCSAWSDS